MADELIEAEIKYGVIHGPNLQRKEKDPNGIPKSKTLADRIEHAKPGEWIILESDPNGIPAKSPGSKLDAGKSPVMQGVLQYFPRAICEIAKVSAAGAKKYSWKGWQHVCDGPLRYGDAMVRHIILEDIDKFREILIENESELPPKK